MLPSEQILENAARDGSIDIAEWPRVLESLLQRLHDIVHNEFPLPAVPLPPPALPTVDPEVVASTPPTALTSDPEPKDDELPDAGDDEPPPGSQSSTKENDAPTDIAASRPPVPGFEVNHTPAQPVQAPDIIETPPGTLPPDLLSLYTTSTRILSHDFAHSPPYTIQRLAELVLHPKHHYRFLPAYLRALDRIVSVSSPVSDFPLPNLHAGPSSAGNFLTNGDTNQLVNGTSDPNSLGSDESLGGALLTPIPWLRHNSLASAAASASQDSNTSSNGESGELHSLSTETITGPHGAGSIETVTVTVNGVPSATSIAHTTPPPAPTSPTLSEQSDASSSSSSGGTTEAQLREQGAVTQGELLRQEQAAGVVPLTTQSSPRRSLIAGGAVAVGREPVGGGSTAAADMMVMGDRTAEGGEHPHARGPEEIGMEDMGPQHPSLEAPGILDMEAAVGRGGRGRSPQPPSTATTPETDPKVVIAEAEASAAAEDPAGQPGRDPGDVEMDVNKLRVEMEVDMEETMREQSGKFGDGDTVVADADGMPVAEGRERIGDVS